MSHMCAAIATDYVTSILANKTIFIPFTWGILLLALILRHIWFWFFVTFLNFSSIPSLICFRRSFYYIFLILGLFLRFNTLLINFFTAFFFRVWWQKVLDEFTSLTSLPSVRWLRFLILHLSFFNFFNFFWSLSLLTQSKLISRKLKHF